MYCVKIPSLKKLRIICQQWVSTCNRISWWIEGFNPCTPIPQNQSKWTFCGKTVFTGQRFTVQTLLWSSVACSQSDSLTSLDRRKTPDVPFHLPHQNRLTQKCTSECWWVSNVSTSPILVGHRGSDASFSACLPKRLWPWVRYVSHKHKRQLRDSWFWVHGWHLNTFLEMHCSWKNQNRTEASPQPTPKNNIWWNENFFGFGFPSMVHPPCTAVKLDRMLSFDSWFAIVDHSGVIWSHWFVKLALVWIYLSSFPLSVRITGKGYKGLFLQARLALDGMTRVGYWSYPPPNTMVRKAVLVTFRKVALAKPWQSDAKEEQAKLDCDQLYLISNGEKNESKCRSVFTLP